MTEFASVLAGAILSTALLLAAHLGLWPHRARVHPVAAYTIGTTCLGLGATVTAGLLDIWLIAITFWTLAGCGGALIASCWWVRGALAERDAKRGRADTLIAAAQDDDGTHRRSAAHRN